jgi:ABC-type polysaccharide/polyol phosphate transport system ATPase subunit
MTDVVIRAEGLGKKYLLGHQTQRERYTALRDVLARSAKGLGRSARDIVRGRPLVVGDEVEEFWALRDVNFEIRRGEVVGIIGRNGAGKSTLLKILSRITEPSAGRVTIEGRIASLLEVGTGFHPELSGRENIYLNGAVLGMSRAEIRQKFDEIVAFAEVKKFLDTPVKRYSSGMYVRLAFAVAAHLEPEILVVDEVLAVGDAEFQKKCLGKMKDVAGAGRTVLFVSHNLAAVKNLCSRGLLVSGGRQRLNGSVKEVLDAYARTEFPEGVSVADRRDRCGTGAARLVDLRIGSSSRRHFFEVSLMANTALHELRLFVAVFNSGSDCVLRLDSKNSSIQPSDAKSQVYRVELPRGFSFAPGSYYLNVAIFNGDCCDRLERALEFELRPDDVSHLAPNLRGDEVVCVHGTWTAL